ncbi:hypothetical protein [Maridesulfovibrio sp. FT414]|uniref:hypothetical protein n=1 Tax=Maridesulfovibrio sp. FT414 TaxID=2979469 RepID=UPI003D809C49
MSFDSRRPNWLNEWKFFVLLSFVSFAFAFALRCIELPKWSNPLCSWNGEYIMGTHDAYYWLAGAKGVGSAADHPMARLVAFLGSFINAPLGNIAFWLPAVFAGLTSVAALIWGMVIGGRWVALAGAVYATAIPAFYFRTRLSYYDTDVVTLFFPVLISGLLAGWIIQGVRNSWLPEKSEQVTDFEPTLYDYALPYFAGLMTLYGETWHSDVSMYGFLVVGMGAVLSILCARTADSRVTLFKGLLIYSVASFVGVAGSFISIALIYVFLDSSFKRYKQLDNILILVAVLAIVLSLSGAGLAAFEVIYTKIFSYMKPVAEGGAVAGNGPVYPGVTQSVIEAQNISFDTLFENVFGSKALGWAGFISFIGLVLVRPTSILLAPLALAGLAAVFMGGRFGMFCGLPIGVGLAGFSVWIISKVAKNVQLEKAASWLAPCCVILVLLTSNMNIYRNIAATPIIFPEHVQGLVEAGKYMPAGSTVWTWWDWGYATMYYTGRDSFANGGMHPGPILFPLALPFTTPSIPQANQFIKYCALQNNNPASVWEKKTGSEVQRMIKSFGEKNYAFPVKNKQFIVVTWKDVSLAYWIMYYGSWDVATGIGTHPQVMQLYSPFSVDFENGSIVLKDSGAQYSLRGFNILGSKTANVRTYDKNVGPTLVLNELVRQGFLVDDFAAQSTMLKLLTWNPGSPAISSYFKLLYEGGPFVRIYEVL